ncbi:MAG: transcriptional regulator [Firmicutes bacterium HGW-Firmicutes-4]|jgi:transcription initiation factor TFIIIB Brf1 subunit/transcription initiation factor TFIIB|nr:MAG: transcriptional regulator [Firmicutes bacterium HGW-Firmicutes-4]
MELKDKILALMKQQGTPMTAGEVEKALKVDRKEVDKAFKQLKKEEAIVSPVRCKWEPAKK